MPPVVIANPVLNSPFREPTRHVRFDEDGVTDQIADGPRVSSYFVLIAKPRGKAKDGPKLVETDWTEDRVEENKYVNRVRERVAVEVLNHYGDEVLRALSV